MIFVLKTNRIMMHSLSRKMCYKFNRNVKFVRFEMETNQWKVHIYIQLFQKMLSGRTTNVNCRTAIARLKRNVGIEY